MRHIRPPRTPSLIVLLLLFGASQARPVVAETNEWRGFGPYGGPISCVAVDPATPTTLYAGANGVFKSTNGGGSWSAVSAGLPPQTNVSALAIDPTTPTTLYAGTSVNDSETRHGLFKSTDGGGTWSASGLTSWDVALVAIDPATPTTLYAVTVVGGGVFKSTNGGTTWSAVNTGLPVGFSPGALTLAIDPATPTVLYAGTAYGVFKSANGGGSWSAASTGLPTGYGGPIGISTLAVDPATPTTLYAGAWSGTGVFKSTNGGGDWSTVHTGLASSDVRSLAIDPAAPTTLYVGISQQSHSSGTEYGVIKSTNGGTTWSAVNTGLTNTDVNFVAIDPATPTTLYAGTRGGVFKSTNGGGTWGAANAGLANQGVGLVAIDPVTATTIYARTAVDGTIKSTNGGATWSAWSGPAGGIWFDRSTPTTVYAGGGDGLFKSTNGGETWALFSGPPPGDGSITSFAIDPATPTTLYAGKWFVGRYEQYGGLFKSIDGGPWMASGFNGSRVSFLAIDPTTSTTLYAGTIPYSFYKSLDGGGTWNEVHVGTPGFNAQVLAIDPATPTTLYVAGEHHDAYGHGVCGLFKSTNGAQTWVAVGIFLGETCVQSLAIDPAMPTTLYAGTSTGGVFTSIDAGENWTAANTGLPLHTGVGSLRIAPSTQTPLYAGTSAGMFALDLPPTLTAIVSALGPTAGGTRVTLTGRRFAAGAVVTFGGIAATAVTVVNTTTITATTPTHAAGGVDVVVTNTDGTSGTMTGGFTYTDNGHAIPAIMWANPGSIMSGTPLSATQLNASARVGGAVVDGTFLYTPLAGTALPMGTHVLSTVFTPTDSVNYTNAAASVTIAVRAAPTLTTEPSDATMVAGHVATFAASATGYPPPTVRWQASEDGGRTWTDRAGATAPTLTFTVTRADSGTLWRAVFTNVVDSTRSRAATLTVRAPGDFDGDGLADVLWRDGATGTNAVWSLHGRTPVSTNWLAPDPDPAWALVGTNDFNDDGYSDVLWRHLGTGAIRVWYLDGLTQMGTTALEAEPDLDWLVVGTGDLNGDRKPDLIWRHRVSGDMRVWYLDGATRTGTGVLAANADPAWAVVGTGDVNGDGRPDLILRHGVTGANQVRYLTDGTSAIAATTALLDPEPDRSWAIVGTGDYDGDGHVDMLWRHSVTDTLRVWYLNGTTRVGAEAIDEVMPFTWALAGSGSSAPSAPAGLTASVNGSSITLSWAAPTAGGMPTAYVIEAGAAPGVADLAAFSTDSTGTTYTASGVAAGRYAVRVRAANGAGSSAPSNEVVVVVGPPPAAHPGPPSGLTGSSLGSTLTLTWVAPTTGTGPTGYVIEAGTWPGSSDLATVSTGTTATIFTALGVSDGRYYVRVRAASTTGMSAPSNEVSVRVGPTPPDVPGAPSGLTGAATGSSILLSWTAPTAGGTPTAYRVEAGSAPGLTNLALLSTAGAATTFTANGVGVGRYYVRVRATNSGGSSGPSNEAILAVGCTSASPTGLVVTQNNGGTVAFRWTAAAGAGAATTNVLEAGSAPGLADLANLALGSATTFSTSGVAAGTYYVRVRAKNACGTSAPSNEVMLIVS